jgi:hypothetical protein
MTSFATSIWCPFRRIPSAVEASLVSESCLFSLATLEVVCLPGFTDFALIERESPSLWRWAIIGADGSISGEGRESTRELAETNAEAVLRRMAA